MPLGPIIPSEGGGKSQEENHHKQPEGSIHEGVLPEQDNIAGTPGLYSLQDLKRRQRASKWRVMKWRAKKLRVSISQFGTLYISEMGGLAEGYKHAIDKIWDPMAKGRFLVPKPSFWDQKNIHFLVLTMSWPRLGKIVQTKKFAFSQINIIF